MTSHTDQTLQQRAIFGKEKVKEREALRTELREEIRKLEAERKQIIATMPDSAFCQTNSEQIETLKAAFVSDLQFKAASGKLPIINYASPGAIAYFFGDMILAALPALGDAVSGGKRTDGEQRAQQLAIIDSELIALHAEHASLGGYYRRT